ncbi:hypothetical protein OESDEN_08879 [Oesophagostomum dentatum]|uniref:ERAP1-like C-terminal domain-containing protein n=1 Tax=Oesophagostomum dentatum TaxID=61180 RepID=A0A0B1T148_OESDE|nr:hypothetical protein OESDEN_08879 [Oesophagostomum dentatum]
MKYKSIFDRKVVPGCQDKNAQASRCVSIAPPLREKTYCYGIKMGGDVAFRKVMDLYLAENIQLEKDVLRRSLGCHKNTTALREMMFLALDRNSTFVRLQDVSDIFVSISKSPIGRKLLFNFLIANWDRIYDGMMSEHESIAEIISAASDGVRTYQQLEQLKHLKSAGKHASEFSVFDEVIEESEHRVEWIQKHHGRLIEYFKKLL